MSTETQVKEAKDITPIQTEGEFKIKTAKKMKNLGEQGESKLIKVDLNKNKKDAIQKQETNVRDVSVEKQEDEGSVQEVVEEIRGTNEDVVEKQNIDSPIQEIKDENNNTDKDGVAGGDENANTLQEQKEIPKETQTQELPENIEKLIKFMKETGGDVNDYARLNADYSKVNDTTLLHEYYKNSRPHLDAEERSFIIQDSFEFDEELDEARDVRKKKLAYKEEVGKAKSYLEDLKGKYYDEIKLRPGVTQDQQKATEFFNRYTEDKKASKARHENFKSQTNELLNDDFKGFDFKLGDKKFRYGVKDPSSVANQQADISTFIKTFLNNKGEIKDAKGYHKAIYAARHADTIANHFYEQGKTDAIKDTLAKSKNINTEPRKTASGEVFVNGFKVKAISGQDSSSLKIKKRKFN